MQSTVLLEKEVSELRAANEKQKQKVLDPGGRYLPMKASLFRKLLN